MRMRDVLAVFWITASVYLAAGAAAAQEAPPIRLSGSGVTEVEITREALSGLPAIELDVSYQTSKGERRGRYGGPTLWTVLTELGKLEIEGRHPELRRSITVIGSDGYAILFSAGEISPDFGNTQALIALEIDGVAVPETDRLRLVVPGDRHRARNVRDIESIDIR